MSGWTWPPPWWTEWWCPAGRWDRWSGRPPSTCAGGRGWRWTRTSRPTWGGSTRSRRWFRNIAVRPARPSSTLIFSTVLVFSDQTELLQLQHSNVQDLKRPKNGFWSSSDTVDCLFLTLYFASFVRFIFNYFLKLFEI